MPETMRAAVAYPGEYELRLEERPVPRPGEGEVVVRVRSASVTRGLLALWYFTPMLEMLPAVIGHEAAGEVAEVGSGVHHPAVGDRVRIHSSLTCGRCRHCRAGAESLCDNLGVMGYGLYGQGGRATYERYHNGSLAEYQLAPAANVVPLDRGIGYDAGAKVGTLGGCLGAIRAAEVGQGDTFAVTAATGASGAAAVKLAPLLGVEQVIAIARTDEGLRRLKQIFPGNADVVATDELDEPWEKQETLTQALLELTSGNGLDGMVDYMPVGAATTVQSIMALRRGGTAVLVGGNQAPLDVIYGRIMQRQLHIRGCRGVLRRDEDEVCAYLAGGSLDVGGLITHRFPLEGVNEAVRAVFNRQNSPLFVIIEP